MEKSEDGWGLVADMYTLTLQETSKAARWEVYETAA